MTRAFNPKAAVWAGVIAGLIFMMLEMILVAALNGDSPWAPPRMIAAIVMGKGVLPPPAPFDVLVMMVAMMVHFAMSIMLGLIFGWLISRGSMTLVKALIFGVVFGLIVYVIGFYLMTPIFPWFAMARGGISIFAHIMFGLVLGWSYYALANGGKNDEPATTAQ